MGSHKSTRLFSHELPAATSERSWESPAEGDEAGQWQREPKSHPQAGAAWGIPRGPACVPFPPVKLPSCSVTAPPLPWAGCGQQPPPEASGTRAKRSSPLCNPFTLYILQGSAIPRGERVLLSSPPAPCDTLARNPRRARADVGREGGTGQAR